MNHIVPSIALADLQPPPNGIATRTYTTAAERLAVALSRGRVVLVALPPGPAAALKAGLQALLAGGTRSLPGCDVHEWRAGGARESAAVEEAYGAMEGVARAVLSALCRSSLLRLRADAFTAVLDDLPLSRSAHGSSCLAAKRFVDNFGRLTAAEASGPGANLFADPQEEGSERGLLSVFYAQEARNGRGEAMSAWQVKDSEGQWREVVPSEHEVAVVLGHTMQHACAGLLQPGGHRVVGEPFGAPAARAAGGRRRSQPPPEARSQLQFELRPRPAAVLDLRSQLEAAGHTVGPRVSPVSVSCLMEQFEALLSPAAKLATPEQQHGAAAHAAWEQLQATLKRSKKRGGAPEEAPRAGGPVTRSGNMRRSSEGLAGQPPAASRQRQQAPPPASSGGSAGKENGGMEWEARHGSGATTDASGGSGRSSLGTAGGGIGGRRRASQEPAAPALYLVRGRTCTVLGGCLQDDPADCLTLCVRSFTGVERSFYCNASVRCGAIFEMYCARLGISLGAVKFMLRGQRVFGAATPASLQMKDGEELTAVPESSDRLQQVRELGPLFAGVFGRDASAGVGRLDGLPPLG